MRCLSCQNFQIVLFVKEFTEQQLCALFITFNGELNSPIFENIKIPKPPNKPRKRAERVLAIAYSQPRAEAVINNAGGSIKGDDNQNAITAERGTPNANMLAINGMTSQEQKGASPPTKVAKKIMLISLP